MPGAPISIGKEPCASLVFAHKSLWAPLCGGPGLVRIDSPMDKPTVVPVKVSARAAGPVAEGAESIWMVTDRAGTLARIDPASNSVVAEISVAAGSVALAFGHDAVWVASETAHTLTRINGRTNVAAEIIKVGRGPSGIAIGAGAVWTMNREDGTVSRIDPATNKVTATIKTGVTAAGGAIAVGEGSVWLSAPGTPSASHRSRDESRRPGLLRPRRRRDRRRTEVTVARGDARRGLAGRSETRRSDEEVSAPPRNDMTDDL